jgi:hypothetical protein
MIRKALLLVISIAVVFLMVSLYLDRAAAQGRKGLERVLFVHYRVQPPGVGGGPPAVSDTADTFMWAPKLHWASATPGITYRIDSANSSGLSGSAIGSAVSAGFGTWTLADSNVTFAAGPPVTLTADPLAAPDGINSISWRSLGPGSGSIIAVTGIWYSRASKSVSEVDTVFNDELSFSITPYTPGDADPSYAGPVDASGNPTSFDVTDIATHEFGHWLVLGDLYRPATRLLTMYGYSAEGETYKDTLGTGDMLGIETIYP